MLIKWRGWFCKCCVHVSVHMPDHEETRVKKIYDEAKETHHEEERIWVKW